ncbi:hypothetical protein [Dyella sp.]|uniref:hypothetical protein n=1 Tax=Dyella sp. TaxID=1869338 RepID=UPI002ED3FA2F
MRLRFAFPCLLAATLLGGCHPDSPTAPAMPPDPAGFTGMYRLQDQWLDVGLRGDGYWIAVESLDRRGGCRFTAQAQRDGQDLKVPLDAWSAGASLRLSHAGRGQLELRPGDDDNRLDLSYFCRGGHTLAGTYSPITPPAYRDGHVTNENGVPVFHPCDSRMAYALDWPAGLVRPAPGQTVTLEVLPATVTIPDGRSGRYTVRQVSVGGPASNCSGP